MMCRTNVGRRRCGGYVATADDEQGPVDDEESVEERKQAAGGVLDEEVQLDLIQLAKIDLHSA